METRQDLPESGSHRLFTLIELLVVVAIISVLAAMLLPVLTKARSQAKRVSCLNQLRQMGLGLTTYYDENDRHYPSRGTGRFSKSFVHSFRQPTLEADAIDGVMGELAGSRDIYYCPDNSGGRTAATRWDVAGNNVSTTYQFPVLSDKAVWTTTYPDYRAPDPEAILVTDVTLLPNSLGIGFPYVMHADLSNHGRNGSGALSGLNMLHADGHAAWRSGNNGWVNWCYMENGNGSKFGRAYWPVP